MKYCTTCIFYRDFTSSCSHPTSHSIRNGELYISLAHSHFYRTCKGNFHKYPWYRRVLEWFKSNWK